MATFKDERGTEWNVSIDAPTILRVRAECDPDFLLGDERREDNTYARLQADPVKLCQVMHIICAKQRAEKNTTDEEFYGSVLGNAIDGATEALLQAILSFTPRRQRELLSLSAERAKEIQELAHAEGMKRLSNPELVPEVVQALTENMDARVKQVMTRLKSATATPDSAE